MSPFNNLNGDDCMVFLRAILIAVLVVLASAALALPAGTSCDQIRALVAEHGRLKAIAWAREHGYTWREINEARKCLR